MPMRILIVHYFILCKYSGYFVLVYTCDSSVMVSGSTVDIST